MKTLLTTLPSSAIRAITCIRFALATATILLLTANSMALGPQNRRRLLAW